MKVLKIPYINQSEKFPTGCESVSAVMLLQYLGYEITVEEFIEKYLETEAFEERRGELYGPNPHRVFCGSPYDEESFGCYAPVIKKALEKAIGEEYEIINETGTPVNKLLEEYIDRDMPVIFWACINMRKPIIGPVWKLKDTGENFTWISNEHCMLLVGYDEENYYFNDPFENNGCIAYAKKVVEDRHRAQYEMAVGVKNRIFIKYKTR
ncbi:MAG: C39 family peptidase [Lachnospiraceae bacterium]|nr:C39 family peptidase [Lachnospiraceae bacterium]MDD7026140.1 C39 family peptidase [Lachnospiraceae bacterium]MDY5699663.1 C39 family peptidase [Lachnospiraceae bacterium]